MGHYYDLILYTFAVFCVYVAGSVIARPTSDSTSSVSLAKRDFADTLLMQLARGKTTIADIASSQDLVLKIFAEPRTEEPYAYAPPTSSFIHILAPERLAGERFEAYVWRKIKTVTMNSSSTFTVFGQNINVDELIEKCVPFQHDRQIDERQLALELIRSKQAKKSDFFFGKSGPHDADSRRNTKQTSAKADPYGLYGDKDGELVSDSFGTDYGTQGYNRRTSSYGDKYFDEERYNDEGDDADETFGYKDSYGKMATPIDRTLGSRKYTTAPLSGTSSRQGSRYGKSSTSAAGSATSGYGLYDSTLPNDYSNDFSDGKRKFGYLGEAQAVDDSYGYYKRTKRWFGFGGKKPEKDASGDPKSAERNTEYDEYSFYSGYPQKKATLTKTSRPTTSPLSSRFKSQLGLSSKAKSASPTDDFSYAKDKNADSFGLTYERELPRGAYGSQLRKGRSSNYDLGSTYGNDYRSFSKPRDYSDLGKAGVYGAAMSQGSGKGRTLLYDSYGNGEDYVAGTKPSGYGEDVTEDEPYQNKAKKEQPKNTFFDRWRGKKSPSAKSAAIPVDSFETQYTDKQLSSYYRNNRLDNYGQSPKAKKSATGFFSSIGQSLVEWTMQSAFPCLQYNTVYAVRVNSVPELDTDAVPRYNSSLNLQKLFESARDYKYYHVYPGQNKGAGSSKIKRSIPWDASYDGSYSRADALINFIENETGLPAPYKLYAFGELAISSKKPASKRPNGNIVAYHVAPVVYYKDELVVFDPSVDYDGPMLINDWISAIAPNRNAQLEGLSVCTKATYFWFSDRCDLVNSPSDSSKEYSEKKEDLQSSKSELRENLSAVDIPPPIGKAKVVQVVKKRKNGTSSAGGLSKSNSIGGNSTNGLRNANRAVSQTNTSSYTVKVDQQTPTANVTRNSSVTVHGGGGLIVLSRQVPVKSLSNLPSNLAAEDTLVKPVTDNDQNRSASLDGEDASLTATKPVIIVKPSIAVEESASPTLDSLGDPVSQDSIKSPKAQDEASNLKVISGDKLNKFLPETKASGNELNETISEGNQTLVVQPQRVKLGLDLETLD